MPENSKSEQTLSEISHLFLSSVREKQTRGAPRPQRRPPSSQNDTQSACSEPEIDLTPEEMAGVAHPPAASVTEDTARIAAIVGSRLGAHQLDRAFEYAAQIAQTSVRVGLMEIQAGSLR